MSAERSVATGFRLTLLACALGGVWWIVADPAGPDPSPSAGRGSSSPAPVATRGPQVQLESAPVVRAAPVRSMTGDVTDRRESEAQRRESGLRPVLDNLQGDRRFVSMSLTPLSAEEHHKFLLTLVGGSDIGGSLAKRLYEASEGNPFFTKELLRSLFDSGGVTQDDRGTWTLSGQREIASDMLPATIQQAVETRIGRLPDEMRAVLAIASVMGKSFDFRDLEQS